MFVAASIAATAMGERYRPGVEAFITPTVAHFSAVLFLCLLVMAPTHTRTLLGVVTLAGGAIGLGYCARVRVHMHRLSASIDLVDRLWYAVIPALGYLPLAREPRPGAAQRPRRQVRAGGPAGAPEPTSATGHATGAALAREPRPGANPGTPPHAECAPIC